MNALVNTNIRLARYEWKRQRAVASLDSIDNTQTSTVTTRGETQTNIEQENQCVWSARNRYNICFLTSPPVLATPRFDRPFVIETDASQTAIAGCLLQADEEGAEHPVSYASRILQPAEKRYHSMEQEALAIVFALQQFAPYIEGNGVTTVRTDNQPICALLKKQNLPPRLQRFQLAIQSYNIDLHHRSGDSNKMCDFLSRYPAANPGDEDLVALLIADIEAQKIDDEAEPEDNEEETPQVSLDEIREEQLKIPEYKKLIDALEANIPEAVANFELVDGTLRVKAESDADEPQLVIPYALRQRVIEQVHTSPLMNAHLGAEKTFEKLKRRVFWEAMKTDVRKVVTSCEICQKRKLSNQQKNHEPMMIPSEAKQPNEKLHIDLLGPLGTSRTGNAHVLVCVDAFSKYVTAVALPNITARTVAEALVNEVFVVHSIPVELISDNGAQFTSALWEELVQLIGTKHIRTTPYHPKANGNCERVNLPLVDMIASTAKKCPDEWDKQLKFITFALNTSVHRVTKETPFFLTFGRDARLPIDADWKLQQKDWLQGSEYKTVLARRLQAAWDTVRENIAQNRAADNAYYDAKHKTKEKPTDVGDLVLIQIPTRKSKLEDRWKGPYRVVQVFRPNLVLADLKTSKTIRIHMDRVKRFQETAMLPLRDHGAATDWTMRGEEERLADTDDGETHFINAIKKDRLCHLIRQPNLRKPLAEFLAEASEMAEKLIHKDISLEDVVSFLNVLVATELDYFKDGTTPTTSDTYVKARKLLMAMPKSTIAELEKKINENDDGPEEDAWQINALQSDEPESVPQSDKCQERTNGATRKVISQRAAIHKKPSDDPLHTPGDDGPNRKQQRQNRKIGRRPRRIQEERKTKPKTYVKPHKQEGSWNQERPRFAVRAAATIEVPPGTWMAIPGFIPLPIPRRRHGDYYIHSYPDLEEGLSQLGMQAGSIVPEGTVSINLQNTSDHPITVKENQIIAFAEEIRPPPRVFTRIPIREICEEITAAVALILEASIRTERECDKWDQGSRDRRANRWRNPTVQESIADIAQRLGDPIKTTTRSRHTQVTDQHQPRDRRPLLDFAPGTLLDFAPGTLLDFAPGAPVELPRRRSLHVPVHRLRRVLFGGGGELSSQAPGRR